MNSRKAYLETWGCQQNYHRTEAIASLLSDEGYTITDDLSQADLIVFNTCAVRERAEDKVAGRVGQIQRERKPESILGIGGCMAQYKDEELFQQLTAVDFVFGTSNISQIPALIEKARDGCKVANTPDPSSFESLSCRRSSDYFAWVTIAEGCSNSCSYCIVPQVRGPMRSRNPEEIMEEVNQLVDEGYKEIQLLGQNVNAYGQDLNDATACFSELLKRVAATEIPRISFTTPHPAEMDQSTIDVLTSRNSICRHLHLPLQSGSNSVLRIMNRNYSREEYLDLIDSIRSRDPEINITTDIIVGHPGEKERDFRKTLDLIEFVEFGSVYVAKFSPRPQTRSASLEDEVSEEVKDRRLQKVLQYQKQQITDRNQRFIGTTNEVLVESEARDQDKIFGKNEFKKTVVFTGDPHLVGTLVEVNITAVEDGRLYGKLED